MIHHLWLLLALVAAPIWPGAESVSHLNPQAEPVSIKLQNPAPFPVKQGGAVAPIIGASSGLVVDMPSNTTLYSKDADQVRPIASLTKLMTALLVVEKTKGDEVVTVPEGLPGNSPEESRMGLRPGNQLRVDDLLAGTLIASANDAANLLARHIGKSEDGFVKLMNERTKALGLEDTKFENPSGYGAGENYSTARDLAVLSRAAIAEQRVRNVVTLKEVVITPVAGEPYQLQTTDVLLGGYLPIAGLKTGTSDAAGPCLISVLSSGDRQLLAVVLNSPDRFQENKSMLDWSLQAFRW